VDGDVFAAEAGAMLRFVGGKSEGWDSKDPKDQVLRPAPSYSIVASGTARREGDIYGFDRPNARVIALAKVDGTYHAQYRLAGGSPDWTDLRAMYLIPGAGGQPATLVWMSRDGVNQAILVAVPDDGPAASPGPSGSPSASRAPSGAPPNAAPKPTKKP
jgi:hypothetical protein